MPRIYQISLRTLLELIFVAAVVLAFFYWRNVPVANSAGRYQLMTGPGERLFFIDTKTGQIWRTSPTSGRWNAYKTPIDDDK